MHELGHYLGAAHSPEAGSVMRPLLGDKRANAKAFRIGYDALNTLALNLVSEAWRLEGARRLSDLRMASKAQLVSVYAAVALALPDDPAALRFIQFLGVPTDRLEAALRERRAAGRQAAGDQ